jgi:pimeloyl-ACP methyl ester carboxylesterase
MGPLTLPRLLAVVAAGLTLTSSANAQQQYVQLVGASCVTPPVLHCPDRDCPSDRVINQGPVVEMKTRRTYFLDYPCDLKRDEPVMFVLSLHGAGSYGNWQRHYFPIFDYKDKYRLVIATPNSPTRVWSDTDDEYLQNIVNSIVDQIGSKNIKAFWLVGHSQGGMTSNRIVRTEFFKNRVDGWLSLSGGRLGGSPGRGDFSALAAPPGAGGGRSGPAGLASAAAALREPPSSDFSFIYETGEREMDAKGLNQTSDWAAKYGCGARSAPKEIIDTKAGYVYDGSRQNPPVPAWGLLPGPGKALMYTYPNCQNGRVVADVVRLEKGHTEGLEPSVTESLITLMLSARGGKILNEGSAHRQLNREDRGDAGIAQHRH